MLPLIPRAGVHVNWRGSVAQDEEHVNHALIQELHDTAAKEIITDLVARFAVTETRPALRLKIISVDAIVISQKDYEEAVLFAYRQGLHAK